MSRVGEKPSESDQLLIRDIIQRLTDAAKRYPDMQEVGLWRNGVKPADGLAPPFPEAAMLARVKRCAVGTVRVDPRNDGLRLDVGISAPAIRPFRGRVVRDVAVSGLEWSTGCVSHLRLDSACHELRRSAGSRALAAGFGAHVS